MIFASDNWAGAAPPISEALQKHAAGYATAYGNSELDERVKAQFSEIFEREVAVFFVSTGTAANAIALTLAAKPGGIALCHREAHVIADECGAPELFSGGRLLPVDGSFGRIDAASLEAALSRFDPDFVHYGRPSAVTITQATEIGTVYQPEEIAALAKIAGAYKIPLHMDGARFANALVSLDVTPAEMSWKHGVEILSFGATKNGCWCAEALICFDPALAEEIAFIHKRSAQLFSKSRFVAAQFDAYLTDGLWLDLAGHANKMAAQLVEAVGHSKRVRLAWEAAANEVFVVMDAAEAARLKRQGAVFHDWAVPAAHEGVCEKGETLCRLVTSFATQPAEIERFADLLADRSESLQARV